MNMIEPTVRFPEFKDSWNNYKIEDVFDRVGTPVDLDDTQTYREIGIRSHGKGIFHKEETTATEIGNKRVFWVEPDCFVVNIVFAWERAVAKTTEKENGMIASHRFPMYKPKKDIVDLDYITEYFITKRGQNVLILASPGGAGRNKTLGQKEFAKSVVKLPSLPEQQKIAEFLSTIDTVIEKQKETVSAWEERKKGVMQKLFSQEVRFKADNGSDFPEWEEKTLGDIGTAKMCKRVLKEQTSEKGDVPFYKIGTFGGTPDAFISRELYEELKTKYSFPRKGNILLSAAGTIGRTVVYDGQDAFFQDSNIVWLDNDDSVLDGFLLQFYNKTSWDNLEGGTIKRLYNGLFLSKVIHVPSLPEQQKIADCLSSLDEVIEKQKATLAAWEELKKGLLQQMFV